MIDQSCPNCGMDLSQAQKSGAESFSKEGESFCCRGCAEGTGCTCH